MTDHIHEPQKNPSPPPQEKKKRTPEDAEKLGMKRFTVYSLVLLIAALALITLSFFANNRTDQEVLEQLETLHGSLERSEAQRSEIDSLQKKNELLEQSVDEAEAAQLRHAQELAALDWLREIQSAYESGKRDTARSLVRSFEHGELAQYLSDSPLHAVDGKDSEAPAAVYRRISQALFPDGIG